MLKDNKQYSWTLSYLSILRYGKDSCPAPLFCRVVQAAAVLLFERGRFLRAASVRERVALTTAQGRECAEMCW
jgi:hypothetical protein